MVGTANDLNINQSGFASFNATTGVFAGRTLVAGSGMTITNGDGISGNPTFSATGGGTGDVVGPASSTDNDIVVFNGTTGKLIKDSGATLDSLAAIGELAYFSNAAGDAYLGGKWLKCDGSIYSQATYPTLYTRLGNINPGGSVWTLQQTALSPTGGTLLSVTYGAGLYLAGGSFLVTSTNGISWSTQTTSFPSVAPQSVGYGNSIYLFGSNTGNIYTSPDAVTWTQRTLTITNAINSIIYSGSLYVIAGQAAQISTSTDSITWSVIQNTGNAPQIRSLLFANSTYYYCGDSGTLGSSTDNVTWKISPPSIGTLSTAPSGPTLIYGGGKLVGVGINNTGFSQTVLTGRIATSTDATPKFWTGQLAAHSVNINSVTYGTVYAYGGNTGVVASSTDAVTWTSQTSGTASNIFTMTFGNSLYVYAGAGGVLRSSTDAVTWTSRTSGTSSSILASTYGTVYVYGGNGGVLASSTDAITWNSRTSNTTSSILALTYGTVYVYGGNTGALASSTDAITWNLRTANTTSTINALTYGNSTYIYVGASGCCATSTDATTWVPRNVGTTSTLMYVAYNGTVFVTGGSGTSGNTPFMYTSTDGITWITNNVSGTNSNLNTLSFGNSTFLLAGAAGVLKTSTDFNTWTTRINNYFEGTYQSSYFGSSLFVLGGVSNYMYTSSDGITWKSNYLPVNDAQVAPTINSITSDGTNFLAVGTLGSVYLSSTDYAYNTATQFQVPRQTTNPQSIGITLETTDNFSKSLYIKAL